MIIFYIMEKVLLLNVFVVYTARMFRRDACVVVEVLRATQPAG